MHKEIYDDHGAAFISLPLLCL